MLTVLDVNNFWSPTGGGVRRYELEKARVLGEREGVRFVFALPGKTNKTEQISHNVTFGRVCVAGRGLPGRIDRSLQ